MVQTRSPRQILATFLCQGNHPLDAGEPVPPWNPNRSLFLAVRTPKASLVGEKYREPQLTDLQDWARSMKCQVWKRKGTARLVRAAQGERLDRPVHEGG